MQRKTLAYLLVILALLASMLPATALAQDLDNEETLLEQSKALAAEQNPSAPEFAAPLTFGEGATHPLFVGVDDVTVPAYQIDVTTNATIQAFVGFQVWGSAYDAANDKVYFNNGSTLYEWPVGGSVTTLGTITDPAGAAQAITGLAFYNGTLYGVKNIANEAVYTIDTTTRVATVYIDYVDADYDFGGLAADPNTGEIYATNDDTTPFGSGLYRINLNGTATQIAPYPAGQTDIDGLAVSHDGYAYLVTDEPGFIYVWDFVAGAYTTPLNNPWTSSEVFSAGAWIWSGGTPTINVDPLSLSSAQAPNTTTQQQVNVGNTGGSDLTWSIFEDVSGSPDMVDWSDNFDSYATGSQLHGQGGWKGWDNNPASGALTSSTQARSAPNSADIVGASDLVHEYSGYTSGPWVYTAWQYVPTNFTGRSYFILLNTYSDGGTNNWSTQLCFDATSGLVKDDVPGDCSGATGLPLVTGQWVEIRVEIDLTANTQAVYYNNQLLFQDTWTDHVSGGGSLNIAAVDLFANNASTVYYDDLSLAAPAQPVACDAPDDIPWASVNPTAGTTPGGGSTPVNVTFDSTGLAAGVYTGNLCVTSNDPDPGPGNGTDLVIVPLTLTVEIGTAVTLSGLTADASQSPMPAGAPLAALPAVAGLAMAAFYALRRKAGK